MGLLRYTSKAPTAVFKFRYENPEFLRANGKPHFRVITVPSGFGRFKRASLEQAQELAERRLGEAYGQAALDREERLRADLAAGYRDPAAEKIRANPGLHQDGYQLVSVERVK